MGRMPAPLSSTEQLPRAKSTETVILVAPASSEFFTRPYTALVSEVTVAEDLICAMTLSGSWWIDMIAEQTSRDSRMPPSWFRQNNQAGGVLLPRWWLGWAGGRGGCTDPASDRQTGLAT